MVSDGQFAEFGSPWLSQGERRTTGDTAGHARRHRCQQGSSGGHRAGLSRQCHSPYCRLRLGVSLPRGCGDGHAPGQSDRVLLVDAPSSSLNHSVEWNASASTVSPSAWTVTRYRPLHQAISPGRSVASLTTSTGRVPAALHSPRRTFGPRRCRAPATDRAAHRTSSHPTGRPQRPLIRRRHRPQLKPIHDVRCPIYEVYRGLDLALPATRSGDRLRWPKRPVPEHTCSALSDWRALRREIRHIGASGWYNGRPALPTGGTSGASRSPEVGPAEQVVPHQRPG